MLIIRTVIRYYSFSDTKKVYVYWMDGSRTESEWPFMVKAEFSDGSSELVGSHMSALLESAKRDNIPLEYETW